MLTVNRLRLVVLGAFIAALFGPSIPFPFTADTWYEYSVEELRLLSVQTVTATAIKNTLFLYIRYEPIPLSGSAAASHESLSEEGVISVAASLCGAEGGVVSAAGRVAANIPLFGPSIPAPFTADIWYEYTVEGLRLLSA